MQAKSSYRARAADELTLAKGQVVQVTRLLDSPLYCVVHPLTGADSSQAQADGVVPITVLKPHGALALTAREGSWRAGAQRGPVYSTSRVESVL